MKTRIIRKIVKQIKGFYPLTDCTHALKCRMAAFKLPIFCSMYKPRIMRKIIKQRKGFFSLSDCTPVLKCRMTTFNWPSYNNDIASKFYIPLLTLSYEESNLEAVDVEAVHSHTL